MLAEYVWLHLLMRGSIGALPLRLISSIATLVTPQVQYSHLLSASWDHVGVSYFYWKFNRVCEAYLSMSASSKRRADCYVTICTSSQIWYSSKHCNTAILSQNCLLHITVSQSSKHTLNLGGSGCTVYI